MEYFKKNQPKYFDVLEKILICKRGLFGKQKYHLGKVESELIKNKWHIFFDISDITSSTFALIENEIIYIKGEEVIEEGFYLRVTKENIFEDRLEFLEKYWQQILKIDKNERDSEVCKILSSILKKLNDDNKTREIAEQNEERTSRFCNLKHGNRQKKLEIQRHIYYEKQRLIEDLEIYLCWIVGKKKDFYLEKIQNEKNKLHYPKELAVFEKVLDFFTG